MQFFQRKENEVTRLAFDLAHAELRELFGLDVQEMTVWRPLLDHVVEQLAAGKLVSTEADSFWLPDTAGTKEN